MEQFNRVELRGNVGSVLLSNDKRAVTLSVGTNRLYKDEDGLAAVETTWHRVFAEEGGNVAGLAGIAKGDLVHVRGRIHNAWVPKSDGTEALVTEVVASFLEVVPEEEWPDE